MGNPSGGADRLSMTAMARADGVDGADSHKSRLPRPVHHPSGLRSRQSDRPEFASRYLSPSIGAKRNNLTVWAPHWKKYSDESKH
jgi:hypothetical protein